MKSETVFGIKVEGAYERYLQEQEKKPPKPDASSLEIKAELQNPEQYLVLEARQHGSYSYPDIAVAVEKSHHNETWYQAHESLRQESSFMLTLRQFVDFLNLLKSGTAYHADGKQADSALLNTVLDEIIAVREPWRSEWLDADFKVINKILHINYSHHFINNNLVPGVSEQLEQCLMKDNVSGIDLDYWLKNATSQGLPPVGIRDGSLRYWTPRTDNNSVARFVSDAGIARLYCEGSPADSSFSLGVRHAKILQEK